MPEKQIVARSGLGYACPMVGKSLLGVALVSLVFACTSTSSLLVTRFAKQHSCQESLVRVREAGGNEYVAEGCGHRTRYICGSFAGDKGCVEQGIVPQAGELPRRAPGPGHEDPPR